MIDVDSHTRTIFCDALDRESPEERINFLKEACGADTELRNRIEALLRAHEGAGSFLGGTWGEDKTIEHVPLAERPGTAIGPYELLQQIGEGGFGVVFLAEQRRPIRRRAALKVIKPGMDTKQVIARFEAERQALALMDHPHIARVFDAGTTDSGRPYFVMELVQGVPITEYCDQCNLTMRERLKLFVSVCEAVQHAHEKGVIHRDIKPTNVLVAIQDGQAVPKIIDFGVAKAINQQLTEHTLLTAFAQVVGTPLYMSPEQAELSPLGVDTRSDIYSLGALLYELLTSETPFDKDRLHAASYEEFRRIIREEEPQRPSDRLSTLAADAGVTVAEHRRTDAHRLKQQMRGELDWIVMKCLEKDRSRRYESAGELARDVERYLNDEPVQACPPSLAYRAKKFVRRHKIAAGFLLVLAISGAALVVSNIQSRRSEQRAITESARATAVSQLLQEMLASANAMEGKGSQYTVRELLDDFSANLGDQLADQPAAEADIHDTIARAYKSLNAPQKAQFHYERAIELRGQAAGPEHKSMAPLLVSYGWNLHDQGQYREAEAQIHKALAIYEQQGGAPEEVLAAMSALQKVLIASGRPKEAESLTDEALSIAGRSGMDLRAMASMLERYAGLKIQRGDCVEGERLAREALAMQRRIGGEQHLTVAWGLKQLSRALSGQNKLTEAEAAAREGLEIVRRHYDADHPNTRQFSADLEKILIARGDRQGMKEVFREQFELSVSANNEKLIDAYLQRAEVYSNAEHLSEAADALNSAAPYAKNAAEEARKRIADAYVNVSFRALNAREPDFVLAEIAARRAIELRPDSGFAAANLGAALRFQRRLDEAAAYGRMALELNPEITRLYFELSETLERQGKASEAAAVLQQGLDREPDNPKLYNEWAWQLAAALDPNRRNPTRAVELAQKAVELEPQSASFWNTLGVARYRAGQWQAAIDACEHSITLNGDDPWNWYFLAMAYWKLGQKPEARQWFDKAVTWSITATNEELTRFRAEAAEVLGISDKGRGPGSGATGERDADPVASQRTTAD